MRAVKRSPLFRIALLTFGVLFAHTARATNARTIAPVKPPCPLKVAAAQPDSEKKLIPAIKQIANPGDRSRRYTSSGSSFGFSGTHYSAVFFTHGATQLAIAHSTLYIPPQRLPFALRI